MIVRMSKIDIIGPKNLLEDVIDLLQELCLFHLEPAAIGFIESDYRDHVRCLLPDEKTLAEMLFLENLRSKIDEMSSYLPDVLIRKSYIEPVPIMETIGKTIEKHLALCRDLCQRKEALQKELGELRRYHTFLMSLSRFLDTVTEAPDLDFIGLTIKEPAMIERLRDAISRLTDWKYELLTDVADDGSLVGLITVEKGLSDKIKRTLSDEQVPELSLPMSARDLTLAQKREFINNRITDTVSEAERIAQELDRFSKRWMPIYKRIREWIAERVALLRASASVFETRMCFFIHGWIPTDDLERVRNRFNQQFWGKVAVDEKEVLEEDLDRVPVVLRNPPYFRSFEVLVKLLPLPKYSSFDPTPFLGIFFPLFFGMILGDIGYGLVLLLLSPVVAKKVAHPDGRHIARILRVCSLYAVLFGVMYGELFGELGHMLFGMRPLFIERRSAVIPLLYFAISVGCMHILFSLALGALSAFKRHLKKEAISKTVHIAIIILLMLTVVSFFDAFPALMTRPLIIGILVLTPLLLFTGGLLAPLEVIKSIGNIVSYARIMAIGLTSVLLASVANELAGMTGDILIGIVVAGLLHIINLILGVFAPAIHSLRLHYVEFFSKFLEYGGRRYEPLRK